MATTAAPLLTLEEFSRLPREGQRHEMSEGELITMAPVKSLHSRIARIVFKALEAFLESSGFGEAYPEAGYVLNRTPLTVRQPDVSVVAKERVSSTPPDSYFEGAPELAVEIVSPSDTAEDLEIKAQQYLRSGGREVWILFPKTKTVHVYYTPESARILNESERLESSVLPGLSIRVAGLFLQ